MDAEIADLQGRVHALETIVKNRAIVAVVKDATSDPNYVEYVPRVPMEDENTSILVDPVTINAVPIVQ